MQFKTKGNIMSLTIDTLEVLGALIAIIYIPYNVLRKPFGTSSLVGSSVIIFLFILFIFVLVYLIYLLVTKIFSENYSIVFENDNFILKSLFINTKSKYKDIHNIRLVNRTYSRFGRKYHMLVIKTHKIFKFYLCLDSLNATQQKKLKNILTDKSKKEISEKVRG